jgi:hypothetical protein
MYISVVLTNTLYKPKWNKNNIVKNLFLSVNVEVYFLHKAEKTFCIADYFFTAMWTYCFTLFPMEWVNDCCLMPSQQFFSYIMTRTS